MAGVVFDGKQVIWKWVAVPRAELQSAAVRFAVECADPASTQVALARDGKWLSDRLIRPVEAVLPAGMRIVLEPDDAIEAVPFAALPGPLPHRARTQRQLCHHGSGGGISAG